jgi:hypothetical protein
MMWSTLNRDTEWFTLKMPWINAYKLRSNLLMKTKLDNTVQLLPYWLQHSRTWGVVSACVSTHRETNFNIFCTSAETCTRRTLFQPVNCSVIYSYEFWISSKWIILYSYVTSASGVPFVKIKSILMFCLSILFLPVTVGERSKACTVFARSEPGIVGSNRTQGMDV